jgi:replicative DNA helicase
MNKTPPHDIQAEQSILCSCLLRQESVPMAVNKIKSTSFYNNSHQRIFEAIEKLFNAGKAIDMVTVMNCLKESGHLKITGGASYLAELTSIPSSPSKVEAHCEIVKDKERARNLITIAADVQASCYDGMSSSNVIDDLGKRFFEVSADEATGDEPVSKTVDSVLVDIETRYKNKSSIIGIASGFLDIDRMIHGFADSDLILIAGRPSMGKTTLALNMMSNITSNGYGCLFFSLEMEKKALVQKQLSSMSGIDFEILRLGRLKDSDWPKLSSAVSGLKKTNLIIDDTPALSITQIRARSRMIAAREKIDIIFIDYIQIARSKGDTREREIGNISAGLKAIAKELNIPVVALSQLSRECEKRVDKRPMMSDLRDSGSLEQDADIIMFVYRDEQYNKSDDNPKKGLAEIIVSKYRNGRTGTIQLAFNADKSRFENLAWS